jgi:hypothetical protein
VLVVDVPVIYRALREGRLHGEREPIGALDLGRWRWRILRSDVLALGAELDERRLRGVA